MLRPKLVEVIAQMAMIRTSSLIYSRANFVNHHRVALVRILALRQQLGVYKRKAKKPRLRTSDPSNIVRSSYSYDSIVF